MSKKHQVKASTYYLFWGICTISVVFGQLYVGTGYRTMVQSIDRLTAAVTAELY